MSYNADGSFIINEIEHMQYSSDYYEIGNQDDKMISHQNVDNIYTKHQQQINNEMIRKNKSIEQGLDTQSNYGMSYNSNNDITNKVTTSSHKNYERINVHKLHTTDIANSMSNNKLPEDLMSILAVFMESFEKASKGNKGVVLHADKHTVKHLNNVSKHGKKYLNNTIANAIKSPPK